MAQDRESGAAGRAYGLKMGRIIAHLVGAEKISANSNEAKWRGKRVVIKACAPANTSFGITTAMLSRLDEALVAIERPDGSVVVHALAINDFKQNMRDSQSSGSEGRVKLVARRWAEREGKPIARFSAAEIAAADTPPV